jgi:hypothetical protein
MQLPKFNQLSRTTQISLFGLVVLLSVVFFTVNSSLQTQENRSHAWLTSQSATSVCTASGAALNVSFTNTEPTSYYNMNVSVRDIQNGNTISLGTVAAQQTKTGTIIIGKSLIGNGSVAFDLSWTNRPGTDVRYANYNGISCSSTPTVSPSPTPVPGGNSVPKLVQKNLQVRGYSNTNSVAFNSGVTAGNLIVVAISHYEARLSSVSDSRGNIYVAVTPEKCASSSHDCVDLYYAKNVLPGSTTITANFSGTTSNNLGIYEYSGLDTIAPLDKTAAQVGSSTSPNGGSLITTIDNEVYFVVGADYFGNNAAPVAGNGYSLLHHQDDSYDHERFYTEDRISLHGNYQSNFSITYSSAWAIIGASFRPVPIPTATIVPPTATPMPTNTPVPPTPTNTPTPALVPTNTPAPTITSIPTSVPTNTPVPPTPTNTPTSTLVPTNTPAPTITPIPGATSFNLTLLLHGLGNGGDSSNPNGQGNMSPIHSQRNVSIEVFNSQNQLVLTQQGSVSFDNASKSFKGTIGMGTTLQSGIYTVKMKVDQFLKNLAPGIQTITSGTTNEIPSTILVTGDINNDNIINILDYNLLMGCYSDLLPATDCNATTQVSTDLNDDGNVNQYDYNLFLRELTNRGGQ